MPKGIMPRLCDCLKKPQVWAASIAITDTGLVYLRGQSVTKNYPRARELFEEAEDKGDLLAYPLMGQLYQNGEGVVQDYTTRANCIKRRLMGENPLQLTTLASSIKWD